MMCRRERKGENNKWKMGFKSSVVIGGLRKTAVKKDLSFHFSVWVKHCCSFGAFLLHSFPGRRDGFRSCPGKMKG